MAGRRADTGLQALAVEVGEALRAAGQRLITAESCSGGWVAKTCTDIAGSSAWFDSALVAYSNAAKQRLLGVSPATLARHGAVSRETAEAMALGAQADLADRVSLAITGIAGPGGGSADKPVGLVWFAWARTGPVVRAESVMFRGDRDAVRRQSVAHALHGLLGHLDGGRLD